MCWLAVVFGVPAALIVIACIAVALLRSCVAQAAREQQDKWEG